ncbi:hypothetical protein [Nocardia veterana]|uniref:Uncharacterized protein n=1 Tax=Nocardia veterana TaxID=132249 RepID=A0A7X6LZW1_9NOCA|nr:hypothetical protein [Nocardia veterana]NKY87618.1 hypothetical protein [Nocardia veterana]
MRPRPSEVVAGIRSILADTIGPELTSEHARSRLAEIRAVLAQIDWDNVGFALVVRSAELARWLERAGEHVGEVVVPAPPESASYAAFERHYEELAELAVQVLGRLRARLDAQPDDEPVRHAYRGLLAAV